MEFNKIEEVLGTIFSKPLKKLQNQTYRRKGWGGVPLLTERFLN